MVKVSEGVEAKTELGGDLAAGVGAISSNQTVEFTKYVRVVLPLDGYVFWAKADLLSGGALLNASRANGFALNEPPVEVDAAPTFKASGSLHYATDDKQQADANYAVNRVTFTSKVPINDLNQVGPNVLWIGSFSGVKFAFSSRKSFYRQADLHHYVGDAVYPIMESQLVDRVSGFPRDLIVSNSLPIWLAMSSSAPQAWQHFGNPSIVLYPAFLSPENVDPPFGTVDVPPATSAVAMAPTLSRSLGHSQLVRERVKITLWGIDNDAAMSFVDFVNQQSLDFDLFGVMNMPAIRDERSTQVELGTLAKKKTIEYEINYYQSSARAAARKLITSAIPSFYLGNQLVA